MGPVGSILLLFGCQILSLSLSSLPGCSNLWLDCHIGAQLCLNVLLLSLETSQLICLLRIAFLRRDPSNERDFSFKIEKLLLKSKVLRNLATRVLVLVSSSPPQWNIS